MTHLFEKKGIAAFITVLSVTVFIIPQTGCGAGEGLPVTEQDFCFDTVCSVTVYDIEGGAKEAERVTKEVFRQCRMYEGLLSKTKEGSDVYRINHAAGKGVECDGITIDVIKRGKDYSRLSGGAFDITVGGITDLWDFKDGDGSVPPEESIKDAVRHTGPENIIISGNVVRMDDPCCMIDLGGIAKGYIADRISGYMKEAGVKSAVISLGGNIVCIGNKHEGSAEKKFRIGIETPYSDGRRISAVTEISDQTAVTSGVYERYFEEGGRKYHHILDPETGYPAKTDLLSVTVVSGFGRSADCDALSTICILKGLEDGKEILEEMSGYEGLFIDTEGNRYSTEGFFYEKR